MSKIDDQTQAPEAELQALIGAALAKAFPGQKLRFEKRFLVSLGHESITIDGTAGWEKTGRADIIVYAGDRAVAVVELKRGDLKLREKDRKQLLTYAAQHSPRPPLLLLSNGTENRFFDGNNGAPFEFKTANGATVKKLFENAAKIAAADHVWTMETLLGVDSNTWAGFVRNRTKRVTTRLTGARDDVDRPFASDLLFARVLTSRVARALQASAPALMIEGAPLVGKSSLLRELALRNDDAGLAILFIRAGSGGAGLYQRIANLFGEAVEWRFDEQDARAWLRRLSHAEPSIRLVLAIDDLVPGSKVESDLEELADAGFGPGVGIVATVTSDEARRAASGRDPTALEQIARTATLHVLSDAEFEAMETVLAKRHIHFTRGAALFEEYRIPWVLRGLLAMLPPDVGTAAGVTFPATMGFQLVVSGRERLGRALGAERGYRLLARDAFADEGPSSPELALAMSHTFIIRRDCLSPESREALPRLIEQGWVSTFRHNSSDDVVVPRAPEMFLGALAEEVSHELETSARESPMEAGHWLADTMDGLFLGDLIGAQAVMDLSVRQRGFPSGILDGLLERRPEIQRIEAGVFGFPAPDGSVQDICVTTDGDLFEADEEGNPLGEPLAKLGPNDRTLQSEMSGWMILSQLAMIRSESVATGQVVHPGILLEVATSTVPLLRLAGGGREFLSRDIEGHGTLIDIENGVVEGVTAALQQMFMRDWETLDPWFEAALARGSLPLLYRIRTALLACRDIAPAPAAAWMEGRARETNVAMHELLATNGHEETTDVE